MDANGKFPLQLALEKHNSKRCAIQVLVDAYRQALAFPDQRGNLPLHIAAGQYRGKKRSDRASILGYIASKDEKALSTSNARHLLPLHMAVIYESSVSFLDVDQKFERQWLRPTFRRTMKPIAMITCRST